jgi:hypothetical protein
MWARNYYIGSVVLPTLDQWYPVVYVKLAVELILAPPATALLIHIVEIDVGGGTRTFPDLYAALMALKTPGNRIRVGFLPCCGPGYSLFLVRLIPPS